MSQKVQQHQDLRRTPTQTVKTQDPPITGLSPDDDIGVGSDDTGKPGATNGGSSGSAVGAVASGGDPQG